MKDQQPPRPRGRAPDPDPARHGDQPDKPTAHSEESPAPSARQSPMWLSTISQFAAHRPPLKRTLVVGAIVVGVVAFIFGLRSPAPSGPAQIAPDTRQYSVTDRPTLLFEHFIGNVNITPGPSGQVSITEKKNGETDAIVIHYAQHGNTVTATVDIPGGLMTDTWTDFDVKVPADSGFTATVTTGTLEATGLSGRIVLNNTNGAIWATNLNGFIGLKTRSGSINLTNVTGQVAVATQNGTITTTATHLQGRSSIRAESGTINFHGTIGRTGSYLFQDTNGAVGLTLPPGSAFMLAAGTSGGAINSDFRGVTVAQVNGHSEARATVGAAPHALLTIQTASGSIDLHQGR